MSSTEERLNNQRQVVKDEERAGGDGNESDLFEHLDELNLKNMQNTG